MFMARIISKVRKELELLDFYKDGDLEIIKIKDDLCVLKLETVDFSYILKYSENGSFCKCVDMLNMLKKDKIETGIVKFSNRLIIFNNYDDNPFYRMASVEDFNNEAFVFAMANWYSRIHSIEVGNFDKLYKAFSIKNIVCIMKKYKLESNVYFRYVINNFENIKIKLKRIMPCIVCDGLCKEDIVVSNDLKNVIVLAVEKFNVGYKFFDIESILENFGNEMQKYFKNNYFLLSEDEDVLFKAIGNLLKCCICLESQEFSGDLVDKFNLNDNINFLEWSKNLVEWY